MFNGDGFILGWTFWCVSVQTLQTLIITHTNTARRCGSETKWMTAWLFWPTSLGQARCCHHRKYENLLNADQIPGTLLNGYPSAVFWAAKKMTLCSTFYHSASLAHINTHTHTHTHTQKHRQIHKRKHTDVHIANFPKDHTVNMIHVQIWKDVIT